MAPDTSERVAHDGITITLVLNSFGFRDCVLIGSATRRTHSVRIRRHQSVNILLGDNCERYESRLGGFVQ